MRKVLLGLFLTGALFGQGTALDRLKIEAARAKALPSSNDDHSAVVALHTALRDWIESRLPQAAGSAESAELYNLEGTLRRELADAIPDASVSPDLGPEGPGLGYLGFEFKWFPELPDALVVIAHVSVDCGSDDSVYLYRFHLGGRVRVFNDRPESKWGYTGAALALSDPDSQGRRLLLVHYVSVQCASSWMGMAYSVYGLAAQPDARELLLSLGGHLKTGHRRTLQNRPTEPDQNKTIYTLREGAPANIFCGT